MKPPRTAPFFVPGETITLTRNGLWLADGVEISHTPTRLLFAKSLKKDQDGYFIRVGDEAKRIIVEDTPYFVQRLERAPDGVITLFLNDESLHKLRPDTLQYSPARLTCEVHQGEKAKFLTAAYFDLLKDLQEDEETYYLTLMTLGKPARIVLSYKNNLSSD